LQSQHDWNGPSKSSLGQNPYKISVIERLLILLETSSDLRPTTMLKASALSGSNDDVLPDG
jgi:hypothetical protein